MCSTVDDVWSGIESLMRHAARTAEYVDFTGATTEQVDLVIQLRETAEAITTHCRLLIIEGDRGGWDALADRLAVAAYTCQRQHNRTTVIDRADEEPDDR